MRGRFSNLAAGIAVLLALAAGPARAGEVLLVGGTGAASGLLLQLGKSFTLQTGIAVEVVPSLGSGGGISAAADGALDIAVSGRPLSTAERGRGLVEVATTRTLYVLATSYLAPASMTEREVTGIFAARKPLWPDGSTINLILRPRAESDNQVLVSMFPGMAAALDQARSRTELAVAATDQDNADLAEGVPGSLITTTLTQLTTEARKLRMIPINGVAPSLAAFESGAYRFTKVLRFVHLQKPKASATRFVEFLRSEHGITVLREAGCLPGEE